jgi:hypothetical protein
MLSSLVLGPLTVSLAGFLIRSLIAVSLTISAVSEDHLIAYLVFALSKEALIL